MLDQVRECIRVKNYSIRTENTYVDWIPREVAALLAELRLRVKDIEFERREIMIREGKGNKDRITVLPENLMLHLQDQLVKAKRLHDMDLSEGFGVVYLPDALERKYPHAGKSWGWQYVFPSPVRSIDPRSTRATGT